MEDVAATSLAGWRSHSGWPAPGVLCHAVVMGQVDRSDHLKRVSACAPWQNHGTYSAWFYFLEFDWQDNEQL